jgi:hypothetical protein
MNNEPVAWMLLRDESCVEITEWFGVMRGWEDFLGDNEKIVELYTHPVKGQDGCGNCHACLVGVTEHGLPVTFQRMILCPDCGNKRCPKASNHRHQCTESNEPNQRGSIYTHPVKEPMMVLDGNRVYPAFKELTDEEILEIGRDCARNPDINFQITFARAILRKAQKK